MVLSYVDIPLLGGVVLAVGFAALSGPMNCLEYLVRRYVFPPKYPHRWVDGVNGWPVAVHAPVDARRPEA